MSRITLVNIFLSTLCLLLMVNVRETMAVATKVCDLNSRPHPRGLCGTRLADVLQGLCANYPARMKRDTSLEATDPFMDISLDKANALSYLTKRQSGSNVVCECCFHRCYVTELLAYC